MVYDITRKDTFNKLDFWLQKLREDGQDDLIVMLVGNKCDLEHKRQVETSRGKHYAESNGLHAFMETSAKTAHNVNECFARPSKYLFRQIQSKNINLSDDNAPQGITIGADVRSKYIKLDNALNDGKSSQCVCQLL